MEGTKLKNIVILILLLANLFLLAMVGVQERNSARYQEQALSNAVDVLENNGITIDRANIPEDLERTSMLVARDMEAEAALAQVLLGACDVVDQGGGRYTYESLLGQAEFRSNGSFSITFVDGTQRVKTPGGEEEHAVKLLQEAGLSTVVESREKSGGVDTLVLCQLWERVPVYSCHITMEYKDNSLQAISGRRLMGVPEGLNDKSELISVPTALIRVLNGIDDLGDICNEITAMEPGYLLASSTEGTRLIPMWYVTTDAGSYNLNALTGILERA